MKTPAGATPADTWQHQLQLSNRHLELRGLAAPFSRPSHTTNLPWKFREGLSLNRWHGATKWCHVYASTAWFWSVFTCFNMFCTFAALQAASWFGPLSPFRRNMLATTFASAPHNGCELSQHSNCVMFIDALWFVCCRSHKHINIYKYIYICLYYYYYYFYYHYYYWTIICLPHSHTSCQNPSLWEALTVLPSSNVPGSPPRFTHWTQNTLAQSILMR